MIRVENNNIAVQYYCVQCQNTLCLFNTYTYTCKNMYMYALSFLICIAVYHFHNVDDHYLSRIRAMLLKE